MSATLLDPPQPESPRVPKLSVLRAESLAHSMAFMLALVVAQRLIGFVRSVLFCRWLDPAVLGQWEMALAFLTMAAPLAVLGVPGSFGRYIEHYRQAGQLTLFLRRTAVFTGFVVAVALLLLNLRPNLVSYLVFDRPDELALVGILTACLGAVIFFNYITDLFTGLRLVRVVSLLQVVQGVAFATFGIALVAWWQASAFAVVAAYGLATVTAIAAGAWTLGRAWPDMPTAAEPLPSGAIWRKLLPFAAAVWWTNALSNLFALADRYVLLHDCGLAPDDALTLVGNYHSARLLPLLLASVATTLAGVALPHLSHDWEAGRHRAVADRTNLMLKLMAFVIAAGALVVLLAGPVVFDVLFRGKYPEGLAVLPGMLVSCVWMGLFATAFNYLWCAERAGVGSLVVLMGLGVNVGLNLWLVPQFGLHGAVLATGAANLLTTTCVYLLSGWLGMRLDRGVAVCLALPFVLCLGPWGALLAFTTAAWLAVRTRLIFNEDERGQVRAFAAKVRARFLPAGSVHQSSTH